MPGFVDTHTHVSMTYFRGLADDLPLMTWLNDHIWPAEAKHLSPELVYDSALHGCTEMIKNGITTFNDMYFYCGDVARAAEKVGIRALLSEGVLDFPVASYSKSDEIIDYTLQQHEKYKDHDLISIAFGPHAIYTCETETLKKITKLAGDNNLLVHTHLSETETELKDCLKNHKMRPAEYLDSIGFFDNEVITAHSIWLNESEQQILADRNVTVAINTSSNLKLASGFAPIKGFLEKGVTVSIGTDGVASKNNLSILEELNYTSKIHKLLNNDPTFLPAEQAVRMATQEGAKALRMGNITGSIEVGKKADIICLNTEDISVSPMYNPYSHLAYAFTSEQIQDVVVNGKIIMKDRALMTVDETELIEKAEHYRKRIIDEK
jgi:5-methylthioadenosine/S-adenosylhomocysteine deaminase